MMLCNENIFKSVILMHNETNEIIIAHSPWAIEGSTLQPTIYYKGEYLGFTLIGRL